MTDSTTPAKQAGSERTPVRAQETAADHRVQVAAAKLRAALDERLGRTTPDNVTKIAQEDF